MRKKTIDQEECIPEGIPASSHASTDNTELDKALLIMRETHVQCAKYLEHQPGSIGDLPGHPEEQEKEHKLQVHQSHIQDVQREQRQPAIL